MAVFSRILKNLGAMITGRAVTIVQQVIVAPVFISRYSLAQFGEWVTVIQGVVFVACVLAFRRGIVGELAARAKVSL